MKLELVERVGHPPPLVYRAMRDELPRLLPLLPDIDAIEVLSREETAPGVVHVVSRWTARGQVPHVARPFVPARYLSWIDDATWEDGPLHVRYRLETARPDVFQCEGMNAFREAPGGGTDVTLSGEIRVNLAALRGLPRFLHGAAPRVAKYFLGRIRPNLVNLVRAVDRHLSGAST